MTEDQFLNLTEEDFLEIWNIFKKESTIKTSKGTPIGFNDFLKSKYNLDLDSIIDKKTKTLNGIN